jgi:hypothetical protein
MLNQPRLIIVMIFWILRFGDCACFGLVLMGFGFRLYSSYDAYAGVVFHRIKNFTKLNLTIR